jgi:hypothetical protein
MITVETTNPVYSNASGKSRKDRITARKEARVTRKSNRKAKRNAPKLKRLRRKSGQTSFVMKLIKLVPKGKQNFSGVDGDPKITPIIPASIEYTKTYPDGTVTVVPASDVIVNVAGTFDKNDIAKAFGTTKEALTPEMIDKYLVYIAPASSKSETATETVKAPTSDVAVVVPDSNIVTTDDGAFLTTDTQDTAEPVKDVAKEEVDSRKPLKKYEKIILYGGIGLVLLIAGVIAYKSMKK